MAIQKAVIHLVKLLKVLNVLIFFSVSILKMSYNVGSFSTIAGGSDFLESNGLVAKFAFILLVLFVFVICFRLASVLVTHIVNMENSSPHLIDGMVDATQTVTFTQNPDDKNSVTVYRSANANDGIEFTWSVWIFIENMQYNQGLYKTVFFKGNNSILPSGLNGPNNAPGLFIAPYTNTLVILMNTYETMVQELTIPDIPLNKWVNVIMRCQNKTFDVYVNGVVTRSVELFGVPKQNYGSVYVAANGGFQGNISNLWYFDHAIGSREIQQITESGPNLNMKGKIQSTGTDYLSLRWYFNGGGNTINSKS